MVGRAGAVRLPDNAYSLRWMIERIRSRVSSTTFVSLLKALAPDVYERLEDKSPMGCYFGLMDVVGKMFPIWEHELEDDVFACSDDPFEEIEFQGITVDCFGVDLEFDGPEGISSPSIAVCLCWNTPGNEMGERYAYTDFPCLEEYAAKLPPLPEDATFCGAAQLKPRRWRWQSPWECLGDLHAYAHNATGHIFLDMDYSTLYSGYVERVPWNLDEIKNLAKMWQRTEPIYNGIVKLRDYIDARPRKRLPILAGVLAGYEDVARRICDRS